MRNDKTIELVIANEYKIVIGLTIDLEAFAKDSKNVKYSGGEITSNINPVRSLIFGPKGQEFENTKNLLEDMILVHAVKGIDVSSEEYVAGIDRFVKELIRNYQ